MMPSRASRSSSNSDRNSMASNEGHPPHHHHHSGHGSGPASPTYLLEHLATFTVSPENDLVYPADGMRRLLAMEKTNGIWTQKMLMRMERKMVNIMDHENKDIVEQFPLALVREPTAFTSNDPKEMYNNILIYIVGHPPGESPIPAEMHIFQCVNVRARDLVEDMKAFLHGRAGGRYPNEVEVADLGYPDARDGGGGGLGAGPGGGRMQAQLGDPRGGRERGAAGDAEDASSTTSDKYEKDVTVLNRCFDDIEKFIARLQHAAAAYRELEKRRRSRKSKKKDLGDGMLSMRAKPPPEREFVDIFQKFKLSFNLLARLKAHIHEPNAPELVHFLFTPLALIVDASHDSHYGPNLPSKVVAPLLTDEAVDLLINCLTSKESELWHSLGQSWYVAAEEWKGYVPPYRPVFMDGWSPSYDDDDEVDKGMHSRKHHRRDEEEYLEEEARQQYGDSDNDYRGASSRSGGGRYAARRNSDLSADSDRNGAGASEPLSRFEQAQLAFLSDLVDSGSRVVQVTYPRKANNEKELTVVRGEFLEVLDDTRKWWKTRNIHGQVAHVPHTLVTDDFDRAMILKAANAAGGARNKAPGEYRYF